MPTTCVNHLHVHGPEIALDDVVETVGGPDGPLLLASLLPVAADVPVACTADLVRLQGFALTEEQQASAAALEQDGVPWGPPLARQVLWGTPGIDGPVDWRRAPTFLSATFATVSGPPVAWVQVASRRWPELTFGVAFDTAVTDAGGYVLLRAGRRVAGEDGSSDPFCTSDAVPCADGDCPFPHGTHDRWVDRLRQALRAAA